MELSPEQNREPDGVTEIDRANRCFEHTGMGNLEAGKGMLMKRITSVKSAVWFIPGAGVANAGRNRLLWEGPFRSDVDFWDEN